MKLLTLNIEGDKHLERVIPLLQKEKADIVCLQEVFEVDVPLLAEETGMKWLFAPMVNKAKKLFDFDCTPKGRQGVLFLTTRELLSTFMYYYGQFGSMIPEYKGPNSCAKVLLGGILNKDGKEYVIATTHFTWTKDGEATEEQRQNVTEVLEIIKPYSQLILCGDFNAPRGKEIFSRFTDFFKDNLPEDVESTIDPNFHRKKGLRLVVDTIFSYGYTVKNVRVIAGVSDHKAVMGEIL